MLRDGQVDVAVIFRYAETAPEEDGIRLTHVLDDPSYLVTTKNKSADSIAKRPAGTDIKTQTAGPDGSGWSLPAPHKPTAVAERADIVGIGATTAGPDSSGSSLAASPRPPAVTAPSGSVGIETYAAARWIAGCERCRAHLLDLCSLAGFEPNVLFTTDDYVAVQAMVSAGLGVAVLPGLALSAHRNPDVQVTELPGSTRRVFAATYGEPPDPPATAALVDALAAR
jgi:hypothetical protein